MKSRKKKSFYVPNFTFAGEQENLEKKCHSLGCHEEGHFPAPSSRENAEYLWFCLEHVREYNQKWDFYAGMSQEEIESHRKEDLTGRRPTWPFGRTSSKDFLETKFPLWGAFSPLKKGERIDRAPLPSLVLKPDEQRALALFKLDVPFEKETLKYQYKLLVKAYHPDHHQNNPSAEEHLKEINQGYLLLKKLLEKFGESTYAT